MSEQPDYSTTSDALVERIRALIPAHPEIVAFTDAWQLFTVPGFKCDDLALTMFQAAWALAKAQALATAEGSPR
jgi:hypothetical protein